MELLELDWRHDSSLTLLSEVLKALYHDVSLGWERKTGNEHVKSS